MYQANLRKKGSLLALTTAIFLLSISLATAEPRKGLGFTLGPAKWTAEAMIPSSDQNTITQESNGYFLDTNFQFVANKNLSLLLFANVYQGDAKISSNNNDLLEDFQSVNNNGFFEAIQRGYGGELRLWSGDFFLGLRTGQYKQRLSYLPQGESARQTLNSSATSASGLSVGIERNQLILRIVYDQADFPYKEYINSSEEDDSPGTSMKGYGVSLSIGFRK